MGLRGVGGGEAEVQGKGLTRESLGCVVPAPLPLIPSGVIVLWALCARVSPGSESMSLAWGLGQSWSPRRV